VKIRIVRATIVNGEACAVGKIVDVKDDIAKLLIGIGKAVAEKGGMERATLSPRETATERSPKAKDGEK
jgi:hypothetical protein